MSEDAFIKEAAATALGHFRDPRVIPDLIMLLKDGVLREKAAAAAQRSAIPRSNR
ncbi:MAG: hypothetical protein U0361_15485 [Nitrospiraceae bacterium]